MFIALLALFNEGVPALVFHLMEVPTMRLQSTKILLCWSSRMLIYGFVDITHFLEQFVSMGVPVQFSFLWLHWPSLMRGYQHIFSSYGGTHNEAPKRKNVAPLAL